jgi:hypothetical protein
LDLSFVNRLGAATGELTTGIGVGAVIGVGLGMLAEILPR